MKLFFYGADKTVTGSCHCLEVNGKRLLVDCGLQQGADEDEGQALPFSAAEIDCVLVTHAHIDHSGRLPLLVKQGFAGKIIASSATCRLLSIMLLDSAHIQEMDAQNENRKEKRAGLEPIEAIYTVEDARETLGRLSPCEYGEMVEVMPEVRCRFTDAGHLLGSASIEVWAKEAGTEKKIVFSGDIGNHGQPIIRDPQYLTESDYVLMESTYGDREHEKIDDYTVALAKVIDSTMAAGGNVVIPSFAVGRTQELLYFIREIKERRLVISAPNFPVYVDSPLATEATEIYSGDLRGYADEETVKLIRGGFRPLSFDNLHLCVDVEESKALNMDETPKVIISSSGMCEAGRIRHHLKHNLWRAECAILFVGYQANGTLGRLLIDGLPRVKLFGEEIVVRAKIHNFRALSAHADHTGLRRWIDAFTKKPEKIFVVHGEETSCVAFTEELNVSGYSAVAPNFKSVYDIFEERFIDEGITPQMLSATRKKPTARVSASLARLLAVQKRLDEVIHQNENGANKDIARFADQLASLCDKWAIQPELRLRRKKR